eukprot:CAMPEP_0182566860 /NCGR_PEP_ID=MMETSP1324-20130603/8219_1 /TAXON_ID=236786 /ORGANISM="Florenciella sp., Strain RCC1587" /LENGTH=47 /DNA_ID= /DNA_START= /DNA_END= /DNA_ORIENTATION=
MMEPPPWLGAPGWGVVVSGRGELVGIRWFERENVSPPFDEDITTLLS